MSEWISVEDKLPQHGKYVLATYTNALGKHRIIVGCHYERWKEECGGEDDEQCYEHSEEKDEYYLKEGWYEQQDNWDDYSSISVYQGVVTHWMPLPSPPKETEDE